MNTELRGYDDTQRNNDTHQKQMLQPSYRGSTKRNPFRLLIRSKKYSTVDIASSTDSRSPLVPRAFHISQNLAPSTYNERNVAYRKHDDMFMDIVNPVYLSPTLQTLITGVPRYVIMFVLLEQIPRSRAIRFVQSVFTLNQEHRALEWCAKHLVWIPRHGIRAASIEMRHNMSRYTSQS